MSSLNDRPVANSVEYVASGYGKEETALEPFGRIVTVDRYALLFEAWHYVIARTPWFIDSFRSVHDI